MVFNAFQGGDDGREVVGDLLMVRGQAIVAALLGQVDELKSVVVLTAMDGQEGRGGLEVRAGKARVGVRAVLLGRPPAVAIRQAGLDPGAVVLDPLALGAEGIRVERQVLAVNVDAALLVIVERGPKGGVMDDGVASGHLRAGVAEHFLHHVLGHRGVDHGGAEGVAELVGGDRYALAALVAKVDGVLPVCESFLESAAGEAAGPVRVGKG